MNHGLRQLDPRIKLLLLVELLIIFFLPIGAGGYAFAAVVVGLMTLGSLGWRQTIAPLKAVLPLLILVLVLTPLFHTHGQLLVSLGAISITDGGLCEAALLIARFTGITLTFWLMYQTTRLSQFVLTLQWYGLPYTAALVMTLAFRYIPSISRMLQHVREAHRLRDPLPGGAEKGKGFFLRIQEIIPILISVVISSIKTIPALAMSLEHRGVGSPVQRSAYEQLPSLRSQWKDILIGCIAGCILSIPYVLVIGGRIYGL